MRILVHDHSGHPFQVQLSRYLATCGHEVLHLFSSSFQTPKGNLTKKPGDAPTFSVEGLSHRRPYQKYSFVKRVFQDMEYGRLLMERTRAFAPDVVISSNTPLDAQRVFMEGCAKLRCPFVFWVQDLYSIAAGKVLTKKLPVLGPLVTAYYEHMERTQLQGSDSVVLISEDFLPITDAWGVPRPRSHVIPNWAPLDELTPNEKANDWSRRFGLADKFCFLYSGTLGLKHNPDLLRQLALKYRHRPDVRVVVISEGLGANWLKERKAAEGLDNLLLLDFQPFSQYSNVLATADVLMAILEEDAGVFSVPSKVLSYLCARRPLLLAVPSQNLAAKIVERSNAGMVAPPNDAERFLASAEALFSDRARAQTMARAAHAYATENFDIARIGTRFEKIFATCRSAASVGPRASSMSMPSPAA